MADRRGNGPSVSPAPLMRRGVAFLIDWYAGSLVTALPIASIAMQLGRDMSDQDILGFPAPSGLVAGVLGILFGIAYYALVPALMGGQTLGKRLLGVRIVSRRGGPVPPIRIVGRQIVGLMVVEGAAVGTSTVIWQTASLLAGADIVVPALAVGTVTTLASLCVCALNAGHRALHDLLFGTVVVSSGDRGASGR